MYFWDILIYIDLIFFIFVAMTVLYMGVFAIAAMMNRQSEVPKAKRENRFIVMIPAYKNGPGTEKTVMSILGQIYPQRQFDVTVISDHLDEMSNFRLAQQPVTLLISNFKKYSKAKALQLGINNLPRLKIYDIAIVLTPGSVVEPEFLAQMNDAYESAGTKAILAHSVSRNIDTIPARLSTVFDEINNSIFRRGHIALGLSSAISSTGIAFDFNWFKQNVMDDNSMWNDKGLELMLLRQNVYIDYFDDIMVFDEKARLAEDFNRQSRYRILSQLASIANSIRYLPGAIINQQYGLIDKLLQWLLFPRMILMVVITLMSIIMPFIYFTLAIKWWILFAVVVFIFAVATPNYLVDDKWDRTFFSLPIVLLSSLLAKTPLGKKLNQYINKKI